MGILARIKSLFKGPPLSKQIDYSIYRMSLQLNKLDLVYDRLRRREREIFEKCVRAQAAHDPHASLYATECAEVRKILNGVLRSKLGIEQAMLRLRISQRMNDAFSSMRGVNKIVRSAKVKMAEFPTLSDKIGEITSVLAGALPEEHRVSVPLESEAKLVLEQAMSLAEAKIAEKFPRVPVDLRVPEAEKHIEASLSDGGGTLEKEVRDYLQAFGEMDAIQCAFDLGYPIESVEKVVSKLRDQDQGKA